MIQTATHHGAAVQAAINPAAHYVLVPPPDYVTIPLTGAVVILAAILIAAIFAARVTRAAGTPLREVLDHCRRLGAQLEELTAALSATDARVGALAARFDEYSRSAQGATTTSYNVAIRLARRGASRQELMTTCGVTQQEADLVLRLHATDPARSAA